MQTNTGRIVVWIAVALAIVAAVGFVVTLIVSPVK
jgi:hypothetical protein